VAGISITTERAAAGERHQLSIRLDASHAREPRAIRGHVFIDTSDPEFPTLTVPVSAALLAL
jgi:hypothetical protein